MDDNNLFEYLFKAVVGLSVAVTAFFTKRVVDDVGRTKDDLASHRLYVSEHYATKTDVVGQFKMIHDDMKEIKQDIKTLIRGDK